MKTIQENNAGTDWESKLLKDLAYIKKHGRYPFNKKTLAASLIVNFLVLLVSWIVVLVMISEKANLYAIIFVACMMLIAISSIIMRYWRTIKFISIRTPLHVLENRRLLRQFLENERLAFFNNPDAPEVFQIISRSINPGSDQREVMVFIADDKRILINSHFTEQKFSVVPPLRHYGRMALILKRWLKQHINNGNTDITTANEN